MLVEAEGRLFIAFTMPSHAQDIEVEVFSVEDYGAAKSGIYVKWIRFSKNHLKFLCDHELNFEYKFLGKLDDIKTLRWNQELREKITLYHYLIELATL